MFISLFCLIYLSILSGFFFVDMFLGYGSIFFNNSIFLFNDHFIFLDIEYIHPLIKNLPITFCFLMMFILYNLFSNLDYIKNLYILSIFDKISAFFFNVLFLDKLYNDLYNLLFKLSYLVQVKSIDKGILELAGPFGFYKFFRFLHIKLNNFISPLLFNYLFVFFFSLFLFLFILIFVLSSYFNILISHIGLILIFSILILVFFYE